MLFFFCWARETIEPGKERRRKTKLGSKYRKIKNKLYFWIKLQPVFRDQDEILILFKLNILTLWSIATVTKRSRNHKFWLLAKNSGSFILICVAVATKRIYIVRASYKRTSNHLFNILIVSSILFYEWHSSLFSLVFHSSSLFIPFKKVTWTAC